MKTRLYPEVFWVGFLILGLLVYFTWNRKPKGLLAHRIEGSPNPQGVRIIAPAGSAGTDTDARLYHYLLPNSYIIFVDEDHLDSHPEIGTLAEVNLFIEHPLGASADFQKFPAKQNWLMVNHEMLSWSSFLRKVDVFLCKTRHAFYLLQNLKKAHSLKGRVVYTKHTSKDLGSGGSKDWNLFVHFAGKSWLKQTAAVLKAWIDNRGFPEYHYPRLMVSCRDRCLTTEVTQLLNDFDSEGKHKKYPNIQVKTLIPKREFEVLQKTAGVYLCPSLTEGYGHYLNEGRSAGAVVITVNGPPMNELVTPENGILIQPKAQYPTGHEMGTPDLRLEGSVASLVDSKGIEKAVRKYYLLSNADRVSMGQSSRRKFEEDRRYLQETFS